MNQDLANQLNSSKLSNEDIQNLMKTLGQTSLGKKGMKLTPQERNNLLNNMTSTPNPAEYMVEKEDPTKNMTEDEKKQYHREELRKKLREKQGKFREIRSSKVNIQKKYTDQLGALQNLNLSQMMAQNTQNPETTENTQNAENVIVEPKELNEEEQLEYFMN